MKTFRSVQILDRSGNVLIDGAKATYKDGVLVVEGLPQPRVRLTEGSGYIVQIPGERPAKSELLDLGTDKFRFKVDFGDVR